MVGCHPLSVSPCSNVADRNIDGSNILQSPSVITFTCTQIFLDCEGFQTGHVNSIFCLDIPSQALFEVLQHGPTKTEKEEL